jgi:hypothetical protein
VLHDGDVLIMFGSCHWLVGFVGNGEMIIYMHDYYVPLFEQDEPRTYCSSDKAEMVSLRRHVVSHCVCHVSISTLAGGKPEAECRNGNVVGNAQTAQGNGDEAVERDLHLMLVT